MTMSKIDDIESFFNENRLDINHEISLKKFIREGCDKNNFKQLISYCIHVANLPPNTIMEITLEIAEVTPCDNIIEILCLLIEEYTLDYNISYRLWGDIKELTNGLQSICCGLGCLSDNSKYRFAQTLEFMYAYGYTGLNRIIYNVYNSISASDTRYYNEVSISKVLSCVYLVNCDNYSQISDICYGVKEQIKQSGPKYLISLCNYYIGILEYYQNPPSNDLDYFRTELNSMEKSRKKGFKLAEIYLEHRAQNNSETPKALENPYGVWLLGGDSNEE